MVRQLLGVMTPSALGDRHDAYYQLERASEDAALLSSTHWQAGKGGPVASTGTLVAVVYVKLCKMIWPGVWVIMRPSAAAPSSVP